MISPRASEVDLVEGTLGEDGLLGGLLGVLVIIVIEHLHLGLSDLQPSVPAVLDNIDPGDWWLLT